MYILNLITNIECNMYINVERKYIVLFNLLIFKLLII